MDLVVQWCSAVAWPPRGRRGVEPTTRPDFLETLFFSRVHLPPRRATTPAAYPPRPYQPLPWYLPLSLPPMLLTSRRPLIPSSFSTLGKLALRTGQLKGISQDGMV
jgi:hypothetical protein